MNNSDFVITTTAEAKPGKENIVQQAMREVAKAARTQPGCLTYSILRSRENPALTVNFERWASKEDRDRFLASTDVKKFAAAVSGAFIEAPEPVYFEILEKA